MSKARIQQPIAKNCNRILIVRLDRIGDVVLSTPVIRSVREKFPSSHIAFMVRPYAYDVVAGNPFLDEVIAYDKGMGFLGTLKFARFLRKKRFDVAIILHPTTRTHLLAYFAGIPQRVGLDRKGGRMLTKRIPHTKQFGLKHEIDYTLDILRYIGIEPGSRSLYVPLSRSGESRAEKIFKDHGLKKTDTIIMMNPGASCSSKKWPARYFAKMADLLARRHDARIVLISAAQDKNVADQVVSSMKTSCINLAGATDLADVASLLKRARLFISNDSGPVHIACAVGTPVIAIFGRSDRGLSPTRWGPSNKNDIILHKDVGCITCLAHNCKLGFKCLEAVTVEDVLSAADRILLKSGS